MNLGIVKNASSKERQMIMAVSDGEQLVPRDEEVAFQEQVAVWAQKEFEKWSPLIESNTTAKGLSAGAVYRVDLRVRLKRGRFVYGDNVWIKCKWKAEHPVTRGEIEQFVDDAGEVYQAHAAKIEKVKYNGYVFASTQTFDSEAIYYADRHGVWCVLFQDGEFTVVNEPEGGFCQYRVRTKIPGICD
jgi:hypothetical protein